ncbi:hypothetical protein AC579_2075 [Pseudocercospora musae]|uniref:Uncharacterized protein n=1 Tax=Pseudocercospora musae TaxID=113226 RepID=A0A139GXH6_9PEZI|nr:hypothetical protein AC579_2075 [Pseudocercospora musae]
MDRLKAWLSPPTEVQTCHCAIIKVENEYATLFGALAFTFLCTTVALSFISIPTQKYALSYIAETASDALNDLFEVFVRFLIIAYECTFQPFDFVFKEVAGSYKAFSMWLGIARTRSNDSAPSTVQDDKPKEASEKPLMDKTEESEELEYVLLDSATAEAF